MRCWFCRCLLSIARHVSTRHEQHAGSIAFPVRVGFVNAMCARSLVRHNTTRSLVGDCHSTLIQNSWKIDELVRLGHVNKQGGGVEGKWSGVDCIVQWSLARLLDPVTSRSLPLVLVFLFRWFLVSFRGELYSFRSSTNCISVSIHHSHVGIGKCGDVGIRRLNCRGIGELKSRKSTEATAAAV
jgi:hypothetical protein